MSEEVVEERTRERSLRDLYYVLFRHKWKMILFLVAVVATVTVGTFRSPEIYRSEAKLLVQLGRESVTLDPTATTGHIIGVSRSRESEINSELEILKSRELAEKVVDAIGLEAFHVGSDEDIKGDVDVSGSRVARDAIEKIKRYVRTPVKWLRNLLKRLDMVEPLSEHEKTVLGVLNGLDIEALKDSSIISISYEAQSPKLAQEVITKLIDSYLEKHIAVHQTPGSYAFFTQQSEDLRDKLAQAENELRNLRDETGISSLEEQRLVILNHIGNLEQQKTAAEAELAASKAKVQALQESLADMPEALVTQETTGYSDYAADLMRAKLYELQLKEQDIVSKFAEKSQQVQMVRREIAEAQALLDKEKARPTRAQVTKGVNITHQQTQLALLTEEATLSSLQAKVENLGGQLADAQAGLKALNDADLRITRLKREIDIQEVNYRKYSENLEQARIDHALESEKISNISVVQQATLPIKPVGPRKLLNLALGLFLGIFGAIGLAFFSEYIDHSIKTPEEAKDRLQLPTLASIPLVRANTPSAKRRRHKTGGRIWEIPARVRQYYETLGEQLLQSSDGSTEKPRVFAVVSCHRGEGVSTIAANLATWLAQRGNGDVLLVDANTAHPSVHRIFKKKLSPGLVDVLENGQGNGDAILSSPIQKLHILSAGSRDVNLSEIFDSDRFSKRLSSIKGPYRFVVFDLPAVSQTSSVPRLAGLCDGVIIVVEAERLRWEVVQRMKERLVKAEADVLGVVLNKRRFPIPAWLYRTL